MRPKLMAQQLALPGLGDGCEVGNCMPMVGKGAWRPCVRCGNPVWVFLGKNSLAKAKMAVGKGQAA